MMPNLTLVSLWMGLGCSTPAVEDEPPPFAPPDSAGEYLVGTFADSAAGPEGDMPVQAWFPASDATDTPYTYDGILTGTALEHASPACEVARPVAVFSHGNGGIRFQSAFLMERLASHGWVVVAPDHVRNTFLDNESSSYWHGLALRRPLDIAAAYDWLASGPESGRGSLADCIDPDAGYLVIGHSFGGFTAFAVGGAGLDVDMLVEDCVENTTDGCEAVAAWVAAHPGESRADLSDPRAWAVVSMAPAWYFVFGTSLADISGPTLVMGAEYDGLTTWDDAVVPAYAELAVEPRGLVGLEGAGHYSFIDLCPLLGESYEGCGGDAYRPVADVHETIGTVVTAWARARTGESGLEPWLPPAEGVSHWEAAP